jgi:hypothetical protein
MPSKRAFTILTSKFEFVTAGIHGYSHKQAAGKALKSLRAWDSKTYDNAKPHVIYVVARYGTFAKVAKYKVQSKRQAQETVEHDGDEIKFRYRSESHCIINPVKIENLSRNDNHQEMIRKLKTSMP